MMTWRTIPTIADFTIGLDASWSGTVSPGWGLLATCDHIRPGPCQPQVPGSAGASVLKNARNGRAGASAHGSTERKTQHSEIWLRQTPAREQGVPHGERRLRPERRVDHAEMREQRQDRSRRQGEGGEIEVGERQLK